MRSSRLSVSLSAGIALVAAVFAAALIWLLLSDPVTVADAVSEGTVTPLFLQLAQVIYTALLGVNGGDYLKVLRHVQVERFYVSRRYQVATCAVEPQMSVDAAGTRRRCRLAWMGGFGLTEAEERVLRLVLDGGRGRSIGPTKKLDLDRLIWPRTEPLPAAHVPVAEIIDLLVATGEHLRFGLVRESFRSTENVAQADYRQKFFAQPIDFRVEGLLDPGDSEELGRMHLALAVGDGG